MAKRFFYPQQQGERKKAKLNITISDHNFPLSQNNDKNKDDKHADNWGDDNDDEILLLASQACEQAYNDNNSSLPDYSFCMQPTSTSTQICDARPSTSKSTFSFKKPTTSALNTISTKLKDKCELISSPLPGMSKVVQKTNQENLVEDVIFNDKIFKGDTDYVYRQLLQLQEENSKLKSENGKLLEKCVTKEGEVSILRTQLKTSQVAADNARLEKMKVQERVQMEWTDKLTAANKQLQDLTTQLDFKNLEITSIKEKCRMLESSKVKLTQVTVPKNDITLSHKHNSRFVNESTSSPQRCKRLKSASKNVQTENQNLPHTQQLNIVWRSENKRLIQFLPLTIEPTIEQHSLLNLYYNEKLQRPADDPIGCKVFSKFHRIPNSPNASRETIINKFSLNDIQEDLALIAADRGTGVDTQRYSNVINVTRGILKEAEKQLEVLALRTTTAFHREMDEKYIEASSTFNVVTDEDLICGKPLYKEEQAVTARRIAATVYHVLEYPRAVQILQEEEANIKRRAQEDTLLKLINSICVLIDKTSCAILYSGLLQSLLRLLERFLVSTPTEAGSIFKIVKTIVQSRPMLFVVCGTLRLLRKMALSEPPTGFCCGGNAGNLKMDYEQGVLLYKKDSCFLQVLMKQIEAALRCIEKQNLKEQAVILARDLILFCADLNNNASDGLEKSRCGCWRALLQVAVAALRLCATFATQSRATSAITATCQQDESQSTSDVDSNLLSVCRGGLQLLYQCALRDTELCPLLGYNEGHLIEFCEILRGFPLGELHSNMVTEIASAWQTGDSSLGQEAEEVQEVRGDGASATSSSSQPWLRSFQTFLTTD